MFHIVLLSGGSGTRLWPLSNEIRSKQFLKILRDEKGSPISMVQRAFRQIESINSNSDITIAACATQKDSFERQIDGRYSLVLEPSRRNTFAAIMLASSFLFHKKNANPGDSVIVMPIDTYADQAYYDKVAELDQAVQNSDYNICLLGIKPTYPSEKYGYIMTDENLAGDFISSVSLFIEKPNLKTANQLIKQGGIWNGGVFAFKLKYALDTLAMYGDFADYDDLLKRYNELPINSFDYEVLEKEKKIGVLSYHGTWKDLGTWNTLSEEMGEPYSGRVVIDPKTVDNVHIINELNIPLVVLGLHDSVVVATPDGILVSDKHQSSFMKPFVSEAMATRPMYESKRWGEYRVIDTNVSSEGQKTLVKELVIHPDKQISYQKHLHRSEIWVVIAGTGEIVIEGTVRKVSQGSIVTIENGQRHALRAFSELRIIETQFGSLLEEEDITRYGDYWQC